MYNALRKKYPVFEYNGFKVYDDEGFTCVEYFFKQDENILFNPRWKFPFLFEEYEKKQAFFDSCFFDLGMVESVSYWKACCSPKFLVKANIDEPRKEFFKKLWFNGLGEFFYVNNIDARYDDFVNIECDGNETFLIKQSPQDTALSGCLIPVGGGKDSIVTLERLSSYKNKSLCYMINPSQAARKTAEISGFDTINVQRRLDKKILELNAKGYLNGHTPFSAIVAFSAYICAVFAKKKYIVLSNESSANDIYVKGTSVNHQYSKSLEFENDFREYTCKYLGNYAEYFSLLRPFNEWSIVKEFIKYKKYFPAFLSCNKGAKEGKWCCNCPKCLFTFIMLSPFIDEKTLIEIFGENLFEKPEMMKFFKGLIDPDTDKPFECVGTRTEINAALTLAVKNYKGELPVLLKEYKQKYYNENFDFTQTDNFYDTKNNIPEEFTYIGKIADFFYEKDVAILGFGREGRSTFDFLKKHAKPKSITVIDKKPQDIPGVYGERYLDGIDKYDIIMKAPGIALLDKISDNVRKKITSQTDLFLRFAPCRIIGITGTKGKSTTSAATFHTLKKQNFPVRLVGNIGIPVFSELENINEKTIVVYELSCHQLEFVKASPHIAVLLNIFSDHLDHYVSQQAYEQTKHNIYKYQTSKDILISDIKTKTTSKQLSVKNILDSVTIKTKLIGQHNKYNIAAAALAATVAGADLKKSLKALEDFNGLEHRIEFIGTVNGISYYNDSISTIPEATLCAINALENVNTLIIGGLDRGISYDSFAKELSSGKVKNIICAYASGKRVFELIKNIPHNPEIYLVETLYDAVNLAKKITKNGICLLSPAAASYGDFDNFEHRGKVFKQLVQENIRQD